MQQPGWYPDPSGQPNSFRFWDGQSWTPHVTGDPRTPWPNPTPQGQQNPGQANPMPGQGGPAYGQQPMNSSPQGFGQQNPGTPNPGQQQNQYNPQGAYNPAASAPLGRQSQSSAPAGGNQSEEKGKSKAPLIVVGALVGALVIGGAAFGISQLQGGETPASGPSNQPTVNAPSTMPTGPVGPSSSKPSSGPASAPAGGQLRCDNGLANAQRTKRSSYTSTGVTYIGVPDWGFSFHPDEWTWLDDQSIFGKINLGADKKGVALIGLGGVRAENGFTDSAKVGEQTLTCLETYGVFNDGKDKRGEVKTEATTVGSVSGHKTTTVYTPSDGSTAHEVTVYALESGQPGKVAEIITMWPVGDTENRAKIEAALATVAAG